MVISSRIQKWFRWWTSGYVELFEDLDSAWSVVIRCSMAHLGAQIPRRHQTLGVGNAPINADLRVRMDECSGGKRDRLARTDGQPSGGVLHWSEHSLQYGTTRGAEWVPFGSGATRFAIEDVEAQPDRCRTFVKSSNSIFDGSWISYSVLQLILHHSWLHIKYLPRSSIHREISKRSFILYAELENASQNHVSASFHVILFSIYFTI